MNNLVDCTICRDPKNSDATKTAWTTCKHIFHYNCLETWLFQHNFCPNCRTYDPLNNRHYFENRIVDLIEVANIPMVDILRHHPKMSLAIFTTHIIAMNIFAIHGLFSNNEHNRQLYFASSALAGSLGALFAHAWIKENYFRDE